MVIQSLYRMALSGFVLLFLMIRCTLHFFGKNATEGSDVSYQEARDIHLPIKGRFN